MEKIYKEKMCLYCKNKCNKKPSLVVEMKKDKKNGIVTIYKCKNYKKCDTNREF